MFTSSTLKYNSPGGKSRPKLVSWLSSDFDEFRFQLSFFPCQGSWVFLVS